MWSKKSLCHNKTVAIRNTNEPLCIYTGICKCVLDGQVFARMLISLNKTLMIVNFKQWLDISSLSSLTTTSKVHPIQCEVSLDT